MLTPKRSSAPTAGAWSRTGPAVALTATPHSLGAPARLLARSPAKSVAVLQKLGHQPSAVDPKRSRRRSAAAPRRRSSGSQPSAARLADEGRLRNGASTVNPYVAAQKPSAVLARVSQRPSVKVARDLRDRGQRPRDAAGLRKSAERPMSRGAVPAANDLPKSGEADHPSTSRRARKRAPKGTKRKATQRRPSAHSR